MANTTYDTIKNMKPAPWSRSTVADGNALNQNFLEPTHQKDLTLAAAIDQVKNTVDGYNETINNISNVADAAKTQATNAISAANEAQDAVEELQTTVTEMSDAVSAHGESIETLGNNFNTLSAAVAGEAEAITNLHNNKQDKIYVDANTISGNGTSGSPYTVIGGNQKELEFVDSTTVTVHKDEQDDKIIYSFSAIGGGGGGTSYDYAWIPSVAENGDISWTWGQYSIEPKTRNIKGPKGQQGIQGPAGPQGISGDKGDNGFSPTVATATTATEDRTGTVLTFTYGDEGGQTVSYIAWDGKDGTGATIDLFEGTGIQITHTGTNYTIGVSANYALKSELPDVTDMATQTWVGQQGYLTSIPNTYALKTDVEAASANALSEAESWVGLQGFYTKTSGDNDYAPKSVTSTVNTLTAASASWNNKVDKPTSLVDKYLVLRTDNAGNVSGWYDLQEQSYSKSEANDRFVATANIDTTTLSGNGKSANTKLGVKTDVIATKDYVNSSFLPLSGGTVSGDIVVSATGTCLLAVGTDATLMGQSRVVNMGDTTARGTNWLGVTQNNQGFLKYVNGGNVGALDGTSIQINFAPDGANSYGNIIVNSQGNQSKVVHVPTASYDSMTTFDPTSGPNYMLRKTANGFDIGAKVVNVTSMPQNTEANTYYFVYEV